MFLQSKRVLPGFVDTLMCGCGGNVFAFAVTSKRMIIQVIIIFCGFLSRS
jgi:hypothetical protein